MLNNDKVKNILLWFVIALILISIFSNFNPKNFNVQRYTYSQFVELVNQGQITQVTIAERNITGRTANGAFFSTYMPLPDPLLLSELIDKNVAVVGKPPEQRSLLLQIFINWFPLLLLNAYSGFKT